MSAEQQVTDLEIRIAYLEDNLDALDDVVTRQAREIDQLFKANQALLKKLQGIDDTLASVAPGQGDEPPPPHY